MNTSNINAKPTTALIIDFLSHKSITKCPSKNKPKRRKSNRKVFTRDQVVALMHNRAA